ncbi:MAG: hypothetical protein U0795_15095 [Pirellulales bacterium]
MESYGGSSEKPNATVDRLRELAGDPAAASAEYALLLDSLTSDSESVREWAVAALEDCGSPPMDAIASLTGRLATVGEDQLYWTATLLGRLGPAAKSAVDALRAAHARTPAGPIAKRVEWALEKIGAG